MDTSSASADKEERKLCDCDGCTYRRFMMIEKIESDPKIKLICDALPQQNAFSTTTLQ